MKSVAACLLTFCLPALAAGAQAAEPSVVVRPSQAVAGLSQAEWSRVWWQWAGSFRSFESPIADKTGARCQAAQSGVVWFLAGTYGTSRTTRTCTIAAGKYLFFPLINYVVTPTSEGSTTCDDVTGTARRMTDDVSSLVLEIDGKRVRGLEAHRQATRECFDIAARAGGGVFPSAANGYYVMLRPLGRGTHTLNFGAVLPSMSQAMTYTLNVE